MRWRGRLERDVPVSLQSLLYQEEDNPELFGYFVTGCPGQIIDSGNGNVAWDNADERRTPPSPPYVLKATVATTASAVSLTCRRCLTISSSPCMGSMWPCHLNVAPHDADGGIDAVHIPIGLIQRKPKTIRIGKVTVAYEMHAVDLSFAITTWKCQGATFAYIIALLEPSRGSPICHSSCCT